MAAEPRTGRLSRPLVGPFTGGHLLAAFGTLAAAAVLLAVLTAPISGPTPAVTPQPGATFFVVDEPTVGLRPGDRAPELRGTVDGQPVDLLDLDGRPVTLASLRGRPVWLNFWATWCPPCQEETPVLRAVHENHEGRDDLAIVGVSVQETAPEDVRAYTETYGLRYTIAFDATSAIFKAYQAYGLPTQVFIDREGIVRDVVRGPLTEVEAERILAPLLSEA